jgi:preprotein translocase subunit SecD
LAAFAVIVIVGLFLGERMWSPVIRDVQAAVRFEVRLAEDGPAPGLREAKVSGTDRSIYLHDEVVVTNGDISAARSVPVGGEYNIIVEFNASGAGKMRVATGEHIGKPVAILLDGQVIMAPVLRSPIDTSAEITGNFTKADAERIVKGITGR